MSAHVKIIHHELMFYAVKWVDDEIIYQHSCGSALQLMFYAVKWVDEIIYQHSCGSALQSDQLTVRNTQLLNIPALSIVFVYHFTS